MPAASDLVDEALWERYRKQVATMPDGKLRAVLLAQPRPTKAEFVVLIPFIQRAFAVA